MMNLSSGRVVYAFPHAGAGTGVYRHWLSRFNDESKLVFSPVGIPGRDRLSREKVIDDLAVLASRISADIYADFTQRKKAGITEFATFGHSFGGVLSVIVSHLLADKYGMNPVFSVVSGSIAPTAQAEDDRYLWSDEKILEKMRADNGTPESILREPAIARRLVTALRTDYILRQQFLAYRDMRVEQPLLLISADKDEHVTAQMQLAWLNHTRSRVSVTEIQGGHFAVYDNFNTVRTLLSQSSVEHNVSIPA
ncbi:thioesterase domain protein [Yersinia ruckeri]|uniref:thioesterase II family protein n=1 Tax=Yersinia ruckeri TaxID=29486 RepID=UPI0005AD41BB|nr:thioesterase domain-containing protein [Yersinia ruckeri]AJI93743.1 thioesterase domain protein [Yersinia ruckeri]MCW6568129.1 thioesterase domain-containing protein [Yersinia ruckeri]